MYNADIFLISKTKHLNRANDTVDSQFCAAVNSKFDVTIKVKLFSTLVHGEKKKRSFSRHLIL